MIELIKPTLILLVIAAIIYSIYQLYIWVRVKNQGIPATAKVIERYEKPRSKGMGMDHFITYSFEITRSGNQITTYTRTQTVSLEQYDGAERDGQVDILYLPDNPRISRVVTAFGEPGLGPRDIKRPR
jgi:hypothetical protein